MEGTQIADVRGERDLHPRVGAERCLPALDPWMVDERLGPGVPHEQPATGGVDRKDWRAAVRETLGQQRRQGRLVAEDRRYGFEVDVTLIRGRAPQGGSLP